MSENILHMGRNQKQLADQVSKEMGFSLRQGREFLTRVLDLIQEDVVQVGRTELRGLGTFAVFTRPARESTHPVTGLPVHIPARRGVRYRSSKELKDMLNGEPKKKSEPPEEDQLG